MSSGELLLSSGEDSAPAGFRNSMQAVMQAGRDALWAVNEILPRTVLDTSPDAIVRLAEALKGPGQEIHRVTSAILSSPGVAGNASLVAEVRRMQERAAVVLAPLDQPAGAPVPSAATVPEITHPGAQRIVIAGTTEATRAGLAEQLQRHGYGVHVAATGRAAIEHLASHACHLLLLAAGLPDMDSLELLGSLRRHPPTSDTPVVVVVEPGEATLVAPFLTQGAVDVVTLPIDPVLFRARVSGCIERGLLRDRELAYMGTIDRLIDAAQRAVEGRYQAGGLKTLIGHGDPLEPIARALDRGAGKPAAAGAAPAPDPQNKAQWDKASVFIDASQVQSLQAEIDAARKDRPPPEDES